MRLPKKLRVAVCFLLSLMMSNLPSVASAEPKMISTMTVADQMTRAQSLSVLEAQLARQDVRDELVKRGVSPDEVTQRLASLSDPELRQMAGQIEQARFGGDILVAILLVVLIIFLVKRI